MILFTSDTKKSIIFYMGVALFLLLLNYIYSIFSHNVSSNYMTYMFCYPLVAGLFVNILQLTNQQMVQSNTFYLGKSLLNYGIATLVMRSFMKGIFEIAGTDSNYLIYYLYIGVALLIVGAICLIYSYLKTK